MLWPTIIWLASFVLFVLRINSYPLLNWDEAWYGEIIKNMASGKYGYLVPFWNGQYYFDKPPLYFWLTTPLVKLFGIGEWQERTVAVISAAFAVLLVYLIAKILFNRKTAILSALIFISLGQVWFRLSSGDLDSLQLVVFYSSIYFFLLAQKKSKFIYLSGLFLGLSFLVKSWLLGLFPFGFIVFYSVFISKTSRILLAKMVASALLISGWWYILGTLKFGNEFVGWYLFSPGAGKYFAFSNYLDIYYLIIVFFDIGLWLVPLFSLFVFRKIRNKFLDSQLTFLFFSLLFIIGLQFSHDKFDWYLLPIYPIFSFILASLFSRINFRKNKLFLALIVFAFVGQFFITFYKLTHNPDLSLASAQLGNFASAKLPPQSNIYLDDNDFPAFIYYSNFNRTMVVSPFGGKVHEPWIISYASLSTVKKPFWVVSKNWRQLNLGFPSEILQAPHSYQLVKFDTQTIKP